MKQFKKAIRLTGLALLILLASVGLGGGAPIPPPNRRENHIEIKIELKEAEDKEKWPRFALGPFNIILLLIMPVLQPWLHCDTGIH
ncbi:MULTISPECIES: hypothetical protein [unclassified Pedobacter]|uniref:hypothetical protein n=1 Tax=unclassified Pedobacter TaxID=2628915 RepID=UPI00141F6259|nr:MULTISPECIES: hypothetical protein [unclassified Pedobacter]NII85101.1 hypothetical protein [Pedobacter sp. SG908]NMN37991.1 hypothetical protein [Pedobacter sp. SG918]